MAHTRNNGEGESSQQPGPEPSLARVLASLVVSRRVEMELLRHVAENTSRIDGRNDNQPRQSTYQDFMTTHPPLFEYAKEPLNADH